MRKLFVLNSLLFFSLLVSAQSSRQSLQAVRTSANIKIDGDISDPAWQSATPLKGLIEMRPTFNKPEDDRNKSVLYILYDDNAVYFGGMLNESNPDSISTELAGRDA